MAHSRALAALVVSSSLLCPLAANGFLGGCHESEAELTCCMPQEAPCPAPAPSAAQAGAGVPPAASLLPAAPAELAAARPRSPHPHAGLGRAGPQRCALLSVFLI